METIVSQALPSRFWAKVNKSDECWEWTACKVHNGYGQFKLDGAMQYAHRLAYAEIHGPVLGGMQVDHRCHNRACVRPSHLRLVTNKQNGEHRVGPQANSKSSVRGVFWSKHMGKWHARVQHNGRKVHIGYFDTIAEAEQAAIALRNKLFTYNDADRVARPISMRWHP